MSSEDWCEPYPLKDESLRRYERQLWHIGLEGQLRLRGSTALVTGLGGLGSVSAIYLAAAGVGRLILVDKDKVDESNLNRQVLYTPSDVGREKAIVASERIRFQNPDVKVEAYVLDVFSEEYEDLVKESNVIVDGMDGWEQRLRMNELAVRYSKPLVHAAAEAWYGQLMVVVPGETPCLSCVFTNAPKRRCSRVVGPVPGVLGLMQAVEALKLLTGIGTPVKGRLLVVDLKNMSFDFILLRRNPLCPVCGGLRRHEPQA